MAFETLASFGSSLIQNINANAGMSENSPTSLDSVGFNPDGTVGFQKYGKLGDFAKKIDQSAERTYLESGQVGNVRPRAMEILMQQPELVVVFKKAFVCSLVENYRVDLMDAADKLFFRTSKKLFQNICQRVAAYEKLSKIEQVVEAQGFLDSFLLPLIGDGIDQLEASGASSFLDDKTKGVMSTLRSLNLFSKVHGITTWTNDHNAPFVSDLGEGTGTFELTLVESINTTTSINFGGGSASINILDPNELMSITEEDIEYALAQSTNQFDQSSFFNLTRAQLEDTIQDLKTTLGRLRANRNVSQVQFLVNESAFLFKKVRAIFENIGTEIQFSYNAGVVGINGSVTVDPNFIITDQQSILPQEGLNSKELNIFQQIIQNIFILLGMHDTTVSEIKKYNEETAYVRRKLRSNYLGLSLVGQMDQVHIYLQSSTTRDSKLTQGLSNLFQNSFQSELNSAIGGFNSAVNDLTGIFGSDKSTANTYLQTEKNAIVGADFPTWLWVMLRNQFIRQPAGTHVFGGVVTKVDCKGEPGRHSISISCSDNTYYLDLSPVNINPSLDVYNGPLMDPLTPFKDKYDLATGVSEDEFPELLEENLKLLQSGLLKFPNGRFRGSKASELNYKQQSGEKSGTNQFRKVLYDPPGFVYRFKRGIASRSLFHQAHPQDLRTKESVPSLNQNPFSGQDVMNVLSLLITGQPYNFQTFLSASLNSGALSRDDLMNRHGSRSFYRGLIGDLTKRNALWGHFIPFKKLVMNESANQLLISGQADLVTQNRQLNTLLSDRAVKFDQMTVLVPQYARTPQFYKSGANLTASDVNKLDTISIAKLAEEIIRLDVQIEQIKTTFNKSLKSSVINKSDGQLKIFGDDISLDPTDNTNALSQSEVSRQAKYTRDRLGFLTQRQFIKVKANQDQNYLIIDDSYDKNYDIQAFEQGLSDKMELFQSTFDTTGKQIETVSKLLGLEVFADTQGHIQIRPPQYNRVPTSVFEKMLQTKDITGIQVFPAYLQNLFVSQFQGVTNRLEILEDEIRLRCAALGYETDEEAKNFLGGSLGSILSTGAGFSFLTDEFSGKVSGGKDFRSLVQQNFSDLTQSDLDQSLSDLKLFGNDVFHKMSTSNNSFDILKRTKVVNEQSFKDLESVNNLQDRFEFIATRLADKKNEKPMTLAEIFGNAKLKEQSDVLGNSVGISVIRNQGISQVDQLNISNQISKFVSDRAEHLRILYYSIKNLSDGISLNKDSDGFKTILYPELNKSKPYPEIIDHMLEDETVDDYGFGAGKRYILDGAQVLNYNITVEPPPYTMVEVNGLFSKGLVEADSSFNVSGGNGMVSASAIDYEMWERFGYRGSNSVMAPYFSNPDTQCAPFAVYLLNLARKNILQASISLTGNEFLQPGEVYYLEDKNTLFYSESVSHSFNYGGNFSSSMQAKYGHPPGEYIPTMLDIIGKSLYSQQDNPGLTKHLRQNYANGSTPINVLVIDGGSFSFSSDPLTNLLSGVTGDRNRKILADISLIIGGIFSQGSTVQPTVEIRIYKNSKGSISDNISVLKPIAEAIKTWYTTAGPAQVDPNKKTLLPDPNLSGISSFDSSSFKVVEIDLADSVDSPSQGAWHAAQIATKGAIENDNSAKITTLFNSILDIWVTFEEKKDAIIIDTTGSANQAAQEQVAKTLAAFQAKLNGGS